MKTTLLAFALLASSALGVSITGLSGNILSFSDNTTATITSGSPTFDTTVFGVPSLLSYAGTNFTIEFGSNVTGGVLEVVDVDSDGFSGDNAFIISNDSPTFTTIVPSVPSIQNDLAYLSGVDVTFVGNTVTIINAGNGISAFGLSGVTTTTASNNNPAVPEPTSIALLGLGSLALLSRRRR